MKKIEGYQCENCKEIHGRQEDAAICEKLHEDRTFGAKITHMSFESKEGKYGMARGHVVRVPKSIMVKFSDERGDFGRYVLEHYGYRGV